mgnify:FL=1
MVVDFPLYGEACILEVTIWAEGNQKIRLIVEDAEKSETFLTNRTGSVRGLKTYYVRIPYAPDLALIEVMSESGSDDLVGIEDIQISNLPTDYSHKHFSNPETKSFINFAEEFCHNAGSLETNKDYFSDDEIFNIVYLDVIEDNGVESKTPARISQDKGVIEVSKKDFLRYTMPMRMAILLHEFAHFYLNDVMEDEVEADRNSLMLYLGMGYPRIDAYNVYLDVFENSPSELNVDRYKALNNLFKSNYNG